MKNLWQWYLLVRLDKMTKPVRKKKKIVFHFLHQIKQKYINILSFYTHNIQVLPEH